MRRLPTLSKAHAAVWGLIQKNDAVFLLTYQCR
jgi:hypothetical protein